MRGRRHLYTIICLTTICSWLSACSVFDSAPSATQPALTPTVNPTLAATPTPTEAPLGGTVSIWHAWDEAKLPGLLKAIAAFQEQYPDVVFDVQYVPLIDLQPSFEVASAEGSAPLVLIGAASWGPELYDDGWIADISGLIPPELVDSLNQPAVGASSYQDALIGLPITIEGVVLYRNGSHIPERAATFDDLVSMARQATSSDVVGAYLERSFYFSGGHLIGVGGSLMDSEGYPAFNDEYGNQWVDQLREFERAGPTEFLGDNDLQYFIDNRAGYIIESTRLRSRLVEALGTFRLSIDPWPITQRGSLSGYVEAENVYLAPAALDPSNRAAREFFELLLSPESQAELADLGVIPALSASAATAPGSQVSIQDDLILQAMVALEDGATYPVLPEMEFYPPSMDIALQSIFIDGQPQQAALDTAEAAIRDAVVSYKSSADQNP